MIAHAVRSMGRALWGKRLSIIVVMYNMRRESHRTLHSLSRAYQWGVDQLDYEVIVVDNGSSDPVEDALITRLGPQFRHVFIENASPSPAAAINKAAALATGEILCVMIDGAHILTPGILHYAMRAFDSYKNPIVTPHYFFLGPGQQGDTVLDGYDQDAEDALLASVNWPEDGYRLFEIGQIIGRKNRSWFMQKFECNCVFSYRRMFDRVGGYDERFDFPGGGYVNLDYYDRLVSRDDVSVVGIVGEGTFHQVHGGTTTNISLEERLKADEKYREQYAVIRKRFYETPDPYVEYVGHMPKAAMNDDLIG